MTGLNAGYGGVPVLAGIDLHVGGGEVVALLGPNGAGKTTTLLAISGLVPATAGAVSVLGRSIRGQAPHAIARRGLAHVPEGRALFHGLTVQENLRLGLRGRTGLEAPLALFPELGPLLGRRAGLLSGGEQQMVALARALASEPAVLMVDEMSLGLAPIVVDRLFVKIGEIAGQTGAAVLLVEQRVDLALAIAHRAYVLRGGRIVLSGEARDLARDRRVLEASYLGDLAMRAGS